MYKKIIKLSVVIYITFLISACENISPKVSPFIYSGAIMGTSFSIKASQLPKGVEVKQLQKLIKTRLDEINQSMSTYLDDSELSLINNNHTLQKQGVSTKWNSGLQPLQSHIKHSATKDRSSIKPAFSSSLGIFHTPAR
jgi:thiamine biosynthesis lipoprotein ApbE